MEIQEQINWLRAEDFAMSNPLVGKISRVEEGINKWDKPEFQLVVEFQGIGERRFSLFGELLNACVRKYGKEGTNWTGKPIALLQQSTAQGNRRVLA